jgi:hypothetical protein
MGTPIMVCSASGSPGMGPDCSAVNGTQVAAEASSARAFSARSPIMSDPAALVLPNKAKISGVAVPVLRGCLLGCRIASLSKEDLPTYWRDRVAVGDFRGVTGRVALGSQSAQKPVGSSA